MRSSQQKKPSNTSGENFDNSLSFKYLTPGAFTILTTDNDNDDDTPPDPPLAPQPYRLTPSTRRHKNTSFAIIAEPGNSRPGSRSPSPTGRVSPFRGRGFNPIGSRHASPAPSPPPDHGRYTPSNTSSSHHHSKIPTLSRRGSGSVFGEKITDFKSSTNRRKLHLQLSQSLTNISINKISNKPPPSPSPRKNITHNNKTPAFQRLSPIVGSSPEPSQSQSSPSRIPKSRSQPSSRFNSPTRNQTSSSIGKEQQQQQQKIPSSRTISRTSSMNNCKVPSKIPTSTLPIKNNYKNIQAKVNSFNKIKPKVPPKPQGYNEYTNENFDKANINNSKRNKLLERKESVKQLRTNIKSNIPKLNNNDNNNNSSSNNIKNSNNNTNNINNNNNKSNKKSDLDKTVNDIIKNTSESDEHKENNNRISGKYENSNETYSKSNNNRNDIEISNDSKSENNIVKLTDLLQPSTTTVVSSTTTTVTQPLKIDAKIDTSLDNTLKSEAKTISPMVDGRVLSATSVSNAMNKMNDTVLDTQTIIKEHGLTKLSPVANTIIAMSKDSSKSNISNIETNLALLDTKNATVALPSVECETIKTTENINSNNCHIANIGLMDSRILEQHVQNNMSKLVSPETGNSVQKSINDRILESRTVVAADVKPIQITVQEKPMVVDVQSGNIRIPVNATNGLNERPSLPPSQPSTNDIPSTESQNSSKPNICSRFFTSCKNKIPGKWFAKEKTEQEKEIVEDEEKKGCFNCRKKKPNIKINIENDDESKLKLWDRLKCCGKSRVGDTGCFPIGKRKNSWVERQDSILSSPRRKRCCSKECCKNIFKTIFCCRSLCCKKKVEEDVISRRASMMSKKKSLTPSVPVEDHRPKLDASLVEHTSQMKAAIPVLPLCLAWMCLVMNCLIPGLGTIISGLLCLCIGKPRFSQKDGPRPRIGAFIIDLIIGCGQFFTVLFCLVGWGWSIWWGVIMLKIAKKHKKITLIEANTQQEQQGTRQLPVANHHSRDPERAL